MQCKVCRAQINNGDTRCQYCGSIVEIEDREIEQNYGSSYYSDNLTTNDNLYTPEEYQPVENFEYNYEYNYDTSINRNNTTTDIKQGVTAMVFGILSLFFSLSGGGLIFAIISLVLSRKAKKSDNEAVQKLGRTSFIFTCIALVITILYALFFIIFIAYALFSSSAY